jgi:predicted nucleotidyltransferase component of viral defense system
VSKDKPRNLAASVRHRLTELARKQGEDFQLVLTRYVMERLLYRLSRSPYRDEFVLKGAMLFRLWTGQLHRPTRDLDLLGKADRSVEHLVEVFKQVCCLGVVDDGLVFDHKTVRGERIREDQQYQGVRIYCQAGLGQARIRLQIDVGFGDTVTPTSLKVKYPTLLEFPAPELLAYSRQTVVAEKYQAMVALGMASSRIKDFFDVWFLARSFEFDGMMLCRAIRATFHRRKTALPTEAPLALTAEFGAEFTKVKQWEAFIRKGKLDTEGVILEQVCAFLHDFLMPPTNALVTDKPFAKSWPAGGPWIP